MARACKDGNSFFSSNVDTKKKVDIYGGDAYNGDTLNNYCGCI